MSMKHITGQNTDSTLSNVRPEDVQPNAVDLRLEKVFRITNSLFVIDNENKQHRETIRVVPDRDGYFNLDVGEYEVVMENLISIGENEAGFVVTRSTLNRNGLFLTSGLYDSKYTGTMAGCLHVTSGPARIRQGTRIGQFLLFDAEMLHAYSGDYGLNADGTPKPMETKYHK